MKSMKKLGKVGIAMLLIALMLANVLVPLTVVGSDGAGTGIDYQYYVVKSGDSFSSIAQAFSVSVGDVRGANDLSASSKLYTGQILKIPVSTSNANGVYGVSKMSLNVVEANIKDVISAIALNAGYTVVFKGDATKTITLQLENASPIKAIDYATRMADLSYLKDGNTVFVGTADALNTSFVDSVVLAKYSLKYITADILQTQISSLGLSNVTFVKIDTTKSKIWISAYPKEVAKIKELIDILDVSDNIAAGSTKVSTNFSPINLTYITADEFSSLLGTLGFDAGVTMASKPYTLYTYVTGTALQDIQKIKAVVDKPAFTPSGSGSTGGTVIGGGSGSTGSTTPETDTEMLYARELTNVTRDIATKMLAELNAGVQVFGRSEYTKMIYIYGKKSAVTKALDLLNSVIDVDAAATEAFFVYTPVYSSVAEILSRVSNLNLTGVTFYQYSNDNLAESFIVFCKEGDTEYVKGQLDELDAQNSDEVKWRPVESAAESSTVEARIAQIKVLYPAIATMNFRTVATKDLSGNDKFITYVEATADKAEYIKGLLSAMDAA